MNTHVSMASDPIIIDSVLINTLERYIEANVNEVSCFVAKFLNTFVIDSSLLEPYEVDNFILRNGRVLCAWYVSISFIDQANNIASSAWHFYDIQHPELSSIRISFLLRVLVVDSQPFQAQMHELFEFQGSWERRFVPRASLHPSHLLTVPLAFSPCFDSFESSWTSQAHLFMWKIDNGGQVLSTYFIAISKLFGQMKE
jgi:hypothetical protein